MGKNNVLILYASVGGGHFKAAEAVKNYEKTNSAEEIARNYKSAAEIMIDFKSPNKARSLLKKALVNAAKTSNEDLIAEVNMLLASVE